MLIPLRSDAPLYHRPWATIGIISLNVLVQIWIATTSIENLEPLIIEFGSINPLEWMTRIFAHAGWMHLIGNMIFLWVFGQIVEGKIGWWKFLAVYGGIAAASGLVEQILMLGAHGGSLGASSVIFGLLAIALVWAPDNEVDCLLIFVVYVKTFEIRIRWLAALYLFFQVLGVLFSGLAPSSELLHLLGMAAGLPIGIIMLRRGWVDCEGWDWFSRRAHRPAAPRTFVRPELGPRRNRPEPEGHEGEGPLPGG